MPLDAYSQREPPVYKLRETEMDMMKKYGKQLQRPKLQRQFARIDKVTPFMKHSRLLFSLERVCNNLSCFF